MNEKRGPEEAWGTVTIYAADGTVIYQASVPMPLQGFSWESPTGCVVAKIEIARL